MEQEKVLIGIGRRIKYLRGDESLPSFAEKLGVHKNTLARYEKEKSLPDVAFLIKLTEITGDEDVTPGWLIEGDGPPPAPPYSDAHDELRERFDFITTIEKASEIISLRQLTISAQNLVSYVKGDYLPTDKELKGLCYAFDYFEEWVVSNRRPKVKDETTLVGEALEEIRNTRHYNAELLKTVVVPLEECLIEVGTNLHPEKKAELISILYEEMYDAVLDISSLQERILRLLKLAV